jgi:methionyl-tRNA synthetase
LAEQFGIDALRYYLLKAPSTGDSDFSRAELIRNYNADLADQLGNLLSRVVKLVVQAQGGIVPASGPLLVVDRQLIELAGDTVGAVDEALAQFALHKALAAIWSLIGGANKYIVEVEPWQLARALRHDPNHNTHAQRLATTLSLLVEALRVVAHLLAPFLPATAAAIAGQLGVNLAGPGAWAHARLWGATASGVRVQPGPVLFPKA